ncbi:MAG: PAS domain S-box protein, partial [Nitrospirae bacterium]|nr:PAS domain S-box protein [Nitrospirota bacterium]
MKESLRVELASAQAAENRLKLLLQATSEGITILENGRHIDANKRYAEMLGYDPRELFDISVLDVAAPKYHEAVIERIATGDDRPYKVDCRKKDGTVIRVEVYGHSIKYEGRMLRLSALRDI